MNNKIDAYYLRLSLEDGDVTDGNIEESCSIGSQRRCIQQFIMTHPDIGNSFREFVDDGYSGTDMERPEIKRLLDLVKRGKVRTIIVRDLSRFARNYLEAGHYLEFIFPAYGVRFISINDHYDSQEYGENPAGLDLVIKNLINEMYSIDISKKIKSAVDLKKRKGEYVYGNAPYGYKKGVEKNTIIKDNDVAPIVRRIFRLANEGVTVTEIAQIFNTEKIPTPSQHLAAYRSSKYKVYTDWTWVSVRNILDNRIYTGDTVPFKSHVVKVGSNRVKLIPKELQEVILDTHEAIISRECYFNAQTIVKSKSKNKGQSSNNPLKSKLVCGCCGNKLSKGKPSNKRWYCTKARYKPNTKCSEIHIEEKTIKDVILRAIQKQCDLIDFSLKKGKQFIDKTKDEKEELEDNLKVLKKQLDKIEKEKLDILEKVMDDKITREEFLSRKKLLKTEEDNLKKSIKDLIQDIENLSKENKQAKASKQMSTTISQYNGIRELTTDVMNALIKQITVYPDKRIHIDWNFKEIDEFSENSINDIDLSLKQT